MSIGNTDLINWAISIVFGGGLLAVVAKLFVSWLKEQICTIVDPMFEEHKAEDNERCKKHREDSKDELKDIKDTLNQIFKKLDSLNDKMFEIIRDKQ